MIEHQFILSLQQMAFATPWMLCVIIVCARWLIFGNLFLGALLARSKSSAIRHGAVEAIWSIGVAVVLTAVLSALIGRLRPYLAFADIQLLIPFPLNSSFPSGHTAVSTAIAAAFLRVHPLIGRVSLLLMVFVAVGRMVSGVHYPSDILGGIFVGILSWMIVRFGHTSIRRSSIRVSAAQHHHKD